MKCFEARERREALKLAAESKKARIEDAREKKKLAIESRRIRVVEMEAEVRVRQAEMEEVRARINFMKDLKELGHSQANIERFLAEQFSRGNGTSRTAVVNPVHNEDDHHEEDDTEEEEGDDSEDCLEGAGN